MSPLSARLRALYDAAGARFVEVPVLHPADPFLETAGEDIRKRMFVTEGPQGERLALRPDFTIPVCLMHLPRNPARPATPMRGWSSAVTTRARRSGWRPATRILATATG